MKKLIIPAAFLLVAAGLIAWPDRQTLDAPAVVEQPPASGAAQDLRNTGLTAETRSGLASGYTQTGIVEQPEPARPKGFTEVMTGGHPFDRAKSLYGVMWKGFVESLDITESERNRLREILIAHEAHNIELRALYWSGEITGEEHAAAFRTHGQLAGVLDSFLSGEQIAQFWEENGRRSENALQARQQQDLLDIANGEVGLLAATNNDDLATVQAYISSGADVDMMSSDGSSTPLHNAVTRGSTEMARVLLAAGADPNISTTDDFKTTPLGEAAGKGNAEMIETLIANGADPDFTTRGPGFSPLVIAALAGQTDAVSALLKGGADTSGVAGSRALNHSIRSGNTAMEQLLIDAGAAGDIVTAATRESRETNRGLGAGNN